MRLKRRLAMVLSAMIWALPFEARADSLDASFGFGVASLSGTGVGLILGTINAVMIAARSVEEPASRPLAIIGIVAAGLAGLIAAIGMVVGSESEEPRAVLAIGSGVLAASAVVCGFNLWTLSRSPGGWSTTPSGTR